MLKNISSNKKKKLKNIVYSFEKGINILKKNSSSKLLETIEIAINLKINPKKQKFDIKGFSILPNSINRNLTIAAFLSNNNEINEAKKAKIDIIINEDIIYKAKKERINFDLLITTPVSIIKMGNLNKILSQKGLMPNIKQGTITKNLSETIKKFKHSYVKFVNDKNNIIHCPVGKINLDNNLIKENIETLIKDIKKQKPKNCKGMIIKSLFITRTMGPGIEISLNSLNVYK